MSEKSLPANIPVPDPSALTTSQSEAAVKALREILEARLDCLKEDGDRTEKSIDQRQAMIDASIGHVKELFNEKFNGVQTQFAERDVRTEKTAELNQKAIDAALSAAKESVAAQNASSSLAIAKSEAATTKQIDAISILIANTNKAVDEKIDSTNKATNEKIDDIKMRMNGMAGHSKGIGDSWGVLLAVVALIGGLITIYAFTRPAPPPAIYQPAK